MNYVSSNEQLKNELLDRFIKYTKVWSESDTFAADSGKMPSTDRQFDLAKKLSDELILLGLCDVQVTEFCYVHAVLKATKGFEKVPSMCWLAHLDTVDEVTGKDVKPIVHLNYDGEIIDLQNGIRLDSHEDSYLAQAAAERDTLITSDGTTLLGADDKAGVAEIMTALQYLVGHPEINHGQIEIIFSPDEETGHGMDKVPLHLLKSKFAYTVDGGHLGQLETECFNAYSAFITFTGKACHTGDARKNGMINAICMASRFVENLPANERPETSCGYEGFFAVMKIEGSIEKASISMIVRDFSESGMKKRLSYIEKMATVVSESFGGSVHVEFKEQYKNMKSVMDKNPFVIEKLISAYKESGVVPEFVPIRGGTDGSRLTELGIPTPNIFTGGHNYHSRSEWASLSQMCLATDVLINLAIQVVKKE